VSRLRRLVTDVPPRSPGVRSQANLCEICGGQRATGTDFSQGTSVFPCQYLSIMLHAHLHLRVALTDRTNGCSLGTCQQAMLFRKSGRIGQRSTSISFSLQKVKENEMEASCCMRVRNYKYTGSFDRYI